MFLTDIFRKNKKINVRVKKLHPKAVIPCYAKAGDAGLDLTAVSRSIDADGNVVYGTGLAFEIPEGFVGLIYPRSSTAKKNVTLTNSVGVIDSGYRGEILLKFKPLLGVYDRYAESTRYAVYAESNNMFRVGERVGQIVIMPYPKVQLIEAEELSHTERGKGGFGSSENDMKFELVNVKVYPNLSE